MRFFVVQGGAKGRVVTITFPLGGGGWGSCALILCMLGNFASFFVVC